MEVRCDGNCLADEDDDDVCDANEIDGCTDDTALNYDANATDDDGSCIAAIWFVKIRRHATMNLRPTRTMAL